MRTYVTLYDIVFLLISFIISIYLLLLYSQGSKYHLNIAEYSELLRIKASMYKAIYSPFEDEYITLNCDSKNYNLYLNISNINLLYLIDYYCNYGSFIIKTLDNKYQMKCNFKKNEIKEKIIEKFRNAMLDYNYNISIKCKNGKVIYIGELTKTSAPCEYMFLNYPNFNISVVACYSPKS